jgi:uncharacterized protein (TIGR03083 family)
MDTWPAIDAERRTLGEYLKSLSDEAWTKPSLCTGWTVRQVVAHVIGLSEITTGSFLSGMISNRFSINRLNDTRMHRIADAASNSQLIERLSTCATARSHPPGPVMTLLGEVIVHTEDIHRALDGYATHPVEHLIAVTDFYKRSNLIIPAKKRVAGLKLRATDTAWTSGDGQEVSGPLVAILMAITGRTVALDDLAGDGVATLRQRVTQ